MRFPLALSLSFVLACVPSVMFAKDFEFKLPLSQQSSGNYYIEGTLSNDDEVDFLVDTGAGMVILAERTFQSLSADSKKEPIKRIAARMADGRTKTVNVYSLEHLVLGHGCDVGPLEVAVIPGASNNILGLNVLNKAAPFAIYNSPPSLALSVCAEALSTFSTAQSDF